MPKETLHPQALMYPSPSLTPQSPNLSSNANPRVETPSRYKNRLEMCRSSFSKRHAREKCLSVACHRLGFQARFG